MKEKTRKGSQSGSKNRSGIAKKYKRRTKGPPERLKRSDKKVDRESATRIEEKGSGIEENGGGNKSGLGGGTSGLLIPEVRGTRGSLPEGTSQPDDPGGVGGL